MNCKVSIITASYNYAEYIGETIESVINQTFQNWEMLVIDDGSKDNSIEEINQYVIKDSRVKLLTHPNNENMGLVETLKLGISQAKGDYIVFLESDDSIRNDYIEIKLALFEKYKSVGVIYNDINLFGYEPRCKFKSKIVNAEYKYWKKNNFPHNVSDMFYFKNIIPTFSCIMLKKDVLKNLNWNCPMKAMTDWWLWSQISAKTDLYYSFEKLTNWRMHMNSYTIKNTNTKTKSDVYNFYLNIYTLLPPIKDWKNRLLFNIKHIGRFIKYILLNRIYML